MILSPKKPYISKDICFVETNPYFEGANKGETLLKLFRLPSIDSCHDNYTASVSSFINAPTPTQDQTKNTLSFISSFNDNLDFTGDIQSEVIIDLNE